MAKHRRKHKQAATEGGAIESVANRDAAEASKPLEKPKPPHAKAFHARRKLPDWPVLVLALAGVALSGFLSGAAWLDAELPYCSAGSPCDVVQSSRWAWLFGVPIAAWGFAAFGLIALVAAQVRNTEWHWKLTWTLSLISIAISLYLTVIALAVLDAACIYCLASLGIAAALFAVVAWQWPRGMPDFGWPAWLAQTGVLAVAVVAALHVYHSGWLGAQGGPEDPYLSALAGHLSQTGAAFYGAEWCARCQSQKALFGNSARRLPYVECSPGGRNRPQAAICGVKGIANYPTWIIGGQRHLGVLPVEQLARLSGFSPPPVRR
jgi:uncharacterized membrane protein